MKKGKEKVTEHDKANREFKDFKKGKGKCRLADGTFGHNDSYFPTGPNDKRPKKYQRRVRDIRSCKKVCARDPNCRAFHYYLLDPGAFNNCWIWTEVGYGPNGSDKAYCYLKKDGLKDEEDVLEDTIDSKKEAQLLEDDKRRGPKPTKSLNDFDTDYDEKVKKMNERMKKDKQTLLDKKKEEKKD